MNEDLESIDIGEFNLSSMQSKLKIEDEISESIYLDAVSILTDTFSSETPISYLDTYSISNASTYSSSPTIVIDLDNQSINRNESSINEDTYSLKSFNTIKTNSSCTTLDALSNCSSECSIITVYNCSSQLSLNE